MLQRFLTRYSQIKFLGVVIVALGVLLVLLTMTNKHATTNFQVSQLGTTSTFRWSPTSSGKVMPSTSGLSGNAAVVYTAVSDSINNSIAWSPDGKHLASAGPKEWETDPNDTVHGGHDIYQVEVRDWPDVSHVRLFTGHTGWIESVAWSPNGKLLAASSEDNTVLVWNAQDGALLESLQGYSALAWSPDSTRVVVGEDNGQVSVYNVGSGRLQAFLTAFPENAYITQDGWSPDGKLIVSSSSYSGQVFVWDAQTGKVEDILQTDGDEVWSSAWSPDGKLIATGSSQSGNNTGGSLQIWSLEGGEPTVKYWYQGAGGQDEQHPFASLQTLGWSPNGQWLAGGNSDGIAWVMKPQEGLEAMHLYYGHSQMQMASAVTSVAWSPSGMFVATSGEDDTVQVWEPNIK